MLQIPTDFPEQLFDTHFLNEHNNRILFSGKFGSGKTYFLKQYFDSRQNQINTFWLSPVKYAVGQNEDIFEYIKQDISLQLLVFTQIKKLTKIDASYEYYILEYIRRNYTKAIKTLIDGLSNIDKTNVWYQAAKPVADAIDNIATFSKTLDEERRSENEILRDIYKDNAKTRGSIYEEDIVTKAIQASLNICRFPEKGDEPTKSNILIIDDFDRLDPEHIFRIFNVLSAHDHTLNTNPTGSTQIDNKFGFDKIIIVCDIENIKKIYQHKYGKHVDFEGYIGKFYSNDIFYFSNNLGVQFYCNKILCNLKSNDIPNNLLFSNRKAVHLFSEIIAGFSSNEEITIRELRKFIYQPSFNEFIIGPIEIKNNSLRINNSSSASFDDGDRQNQSLQSRELIFSSNDFPFLNAIRSLTSIFGSFESFKEKLTTHKSNNRILSDKELISLVYVLGPMYHVICNQSTSGDIIYKYELLDSSANYYLATVKPQLYIAGYMIDLPVIWDYSSPYRGDVSYFHRQTESWTEEYIQKRLKKSYGNHKKENPEFGKFISIILDIMQHLQDTGLLHKMGVTSASKQKEDITSR